MSITRKLRASLPYFESRLGNIVMNLAGLEQFHQEKSHDETNGSPLRHPKIISSIPANVNAGKGDAQARVAPIR